MKLVTLFSRVSWLGAVLLCRATPISERASDAGAVVSAGSPVTIDTNGVYIRGVVSNIGNLIVGYASHENGESILRLARSTNGGTSWVHIGEVYRAASATHDVDNADVIELPSGRILFAFRNHDKTADGVYTYYRLSVCYSDDSGETWSFLSQISERAATTTPNGLWEPFFRLAGDGTLQVYYSGENSASDQDNYMRHSSNGGATWSAPITVSGSGINSRDGMTGVASTGSANNLICVFENTESGTFSIDYVLSSDGGSTWGSRTRLYTASNGALAGAPQVVNVGGTLVASFMTNESVPGLSGIDGGQMKVVTSTNGGKTWSASVVVGKTGSHWGGLLTRDSTHFLALYSLNDVGAVSQLYQL